MRTDAETSGSDLPAWAPWILSVLALGLGLGIWEPLPPGIWHDDGVYVLLGRSLAEGEGLRYLGIPGAPLAPKFPPLYPLLLSFVWRLFPGFPDNVAVLAGLNLVLTALTASFFVLYLKKVFRIRAEYALGLTGLVWISAHLWRVAAIPLSEPLFLLCLVFALWAGGRMEEEKGPGPVLVFLAASGLALYARTLGVALLAAGVVTLLFDRRWKAAFGAAVGAGLLAGPWILWTRRASATVPDSLQDTLGTYSGWLSDQILNGPGDFLSFVLRNVGHLLGRISTLLIPGATGPVLLSGFLLAPVLVVGFVEATRRSRLLALVLVFSLGILAVWPFQDVRLLVPFQPLLVLCLALGFWRLAFGAGAGEIRAKAVKVGALVWALAFVGVSAVRLASGWTLDSYRIRSEALTDAVHAVSEKTPLTAVVGAPELWSGLHLFTGRAVVPSARFRPLASDGPAEGTPEEQYEIWMEMGVTHLLVEHGGRVHGEALDRVDALCPPGTVQLLDSQPGQYLVALAWDEECQERVLHDAAGPAGTD
jgi:hypothetical protein